MQEQDIMSIGMVCAKKGVIPLWMRERTQEGKVREIIRGPATEGIEDLLCDLCFILNMVGSCWRIWSSREWAYDKIQFVF